MREDEQIRERYNLTLERIRMMVTPITRIKTTRSTLVTVSALIEKPLAASEKIWLQSGKGFSSCLF